jgi:hypothetical protein
MHCPILRLVHPTIEQRRVARKERRLQREEQGDSTRPTGQREDDGTERAEEGTGSNPGGGEDPKQWTLMDFQKRNTTRRRKRNEGKVLS